MAFFGPFYCGFFLCLLRASYAIFCRNPAFKGGTFWGFLAQMSNRSAEFGKNFFSDYYDAMHDKSPDPPRASSLLLPSTKRGVGQASEFYGTKSHFSEKHIFWRRHSHIQSAESNSLIKEYLLAWFEYAPAGRLSDHARFGCEVLAFGRSSCLSGFLGELGWFGVWLACIGSVISACNLFGHFVIEFAESTPLLI